MKKSVVCLVISGICSLVVSVTAEAGTCRLTLERAGVGASSYELRPRAAVIVAHESDCLDLATQALGQQFTAASPWGMGSTYQAVANRVTFRYFDKRMKIEGIVDSN